MAEKETFDSLLQLVEKEYKEGLLTEKGYRKKKAQIEMDIIEEEFKIGDITSQGYRKKKQKLLSEMECLKSVSVPIASEYTSPSSVANSLSHTEIHKNLMEIFRQKSPLSTAAPFDPSAVPTKAVHGQKKSLKLARSSSGKGQMTLKSITVTLLPPHTYTVPKEREKRRLRDEGRVTCCVISKEEKVETLVLKLRNSFSQLLKGEQFVFLRTTKSGDLFPVDEEMVDVDAVLNLAGSSGLFISTLTPATVSTPTQQVKSQLTPNSLPESSCTPVQVLVQPCKGSMPKLIVAPSPAATHLSPSHSSGDKGILERDLFNQRLTYLIQNESLFNPPDNEEHDPGSKYKLNKERKEFFLAINSIVNLWLCKRKHDGYPPLTEVDNFCVVDDTLFNEYDKFSDNYKKKHEEILLPACPLLLYYCKKFSVPMKVLSHYGEPFIDFPSHSIEDLCLWITETQKCFHSKGAQVFQ